ISADGVGVGPADRVAFIKMKPSRRRNRYGVHSILPRAAGRGSVRAALTPRGEQRYLPRERLCRWGGGRNATPSSPGDRRTIAMALLDPDILSEARELSPLLSGTGFVLGLFLWLFGGRTHRFWLALVLTVAAGVAGLYYGPAYGVLPLVSGLLLAISAGAL